MLRETYSAHIVKNVRANMKAEGFHVTEITYQDCKAIAEKKQSADELVKRRLAEYKQNERI